MNARMMPAAFRTVSGGRSCLASIRRPDRPRHRCTRIRQLGRTHGLERPVGRVGEHLLAPIITMSHVTTERPLRPILKLGRYLRQAQGGDTALPPPTFPPRVLQ